MMGDGWGMDGCLGNFMGKLALGYLAQPPLSDIEPQNIPKPTH